MQRIPLAAALHKNETASLKPWHILLSIYPDPKNSPTVVLRLAREETDVTYRDDLYYSANFHLDAVPDSANGVLATVQLMVSNVDRVIQGYMELYNGGIKAKVELRVVSDNDMTSDPTVFLEFEITEAKANAQSAVFTLGADNPMRLQFPRFLYLRDFCNWIYKGPQCAYAGALATCDHTLEGPNGCRAHNNSTRFGGFPAIDSQGFRVAGPI